MTVSTFFKTEPFISKITGRTLISGVGSTKEVHHITLDIKGLRVAFRVGDALAIHPKNDPIFVCRLLKCRGASGEEVVSDRRSGEMSSLEEFFSKRAHITKLTPKLLTFLAPFLNTNSVNNLLNEGDKAKIEEFLFNHEPVDLLPTPNPIPLQALCDHMPPLLPRFYSIASSPYSHPEEIHLTVAAPFYFRNGEKRYGLASHYLCHLTEVEYSTLECYVQRTRDFTLPQDTTRPIIMVGPGTGVAPFRAFLLERTYTKAQGKNWLFFGERQKKSDFYYQDFFESLTQSNALHLDTAFSRDQEERVYVQDKMLASAKKLWEWLYRDNAHLYIAGAKQMGKDVDATLHRIALQEGKLSSDEAHAFFRLLRKEQRYLIDTY